jgi:AraC family transcriptional regulator, positive regulator of tynA and feaB
MNQIEDFLTTREFDYEGWKNALLPDWGRYNLGAPMESKTFAGRARSRRLCGFVAMDISGNAHRVDRTRRDVRLDGVDHYYAVFQIAGSSTVIQDDRPVQLAAGDIALVDSARPVTYVIEERYGQWLSLQLPRRSLASHLGFEPQYGFNGQGEKRAGRLLFQFAREAVDDEDSMPASASTYMQLAIYDLLGALFSPSDPMPASLHADKLFKRVCAIIRDRFTNPDFGPYEVAVETGISLRYLQKLFTARNMTCSHFIHSVRLDHAARLIQHRASMRTGQPLNAIAYACGFRDYTHFARAFRRRFGYSPGGRASSIAGVGDDMVRPSTYQRA